VIRAILCIGLSTLALALGLWTAAIQSQNHDRGLALNDLRERCSMLEAINGDQSAQILAHDCGPLQLEPKLESKPAPVPLVPQVPSVQSVPIKNPQAIAKAAPRAEHAPGGGR
jgi:hypothetical protein